MEKIISLILIKKQKRKYKLLGIIITLLLKQVRILKQVFSLEEQTALVIIAQFILMKKLLLMD